MKRNRVAIILVAVLSIVAIWLYINNRSGTIKKKLKDFAVSDTAAIDKIFLANNAGKSVTLERVSGGQWKLNGKYHARKELIHTLLYTILKIDVKEPVGKKAKDNIIKRLAGTAIKCEIYQGNKLVKAYYVGGETQDQLGTYMLMIDVETGVNSSHPFVTYIPGFDGYLTPRYPINEHEWRDRTIFDFVPTVMKSVKVEFTNMPNESQQVNLLDNNRFEVIKVKDNQSLSPLDTLAVKQYLSYFRNVQCEGFPDELPNAVKDSIIATTPQHIITVTTRDGAVTTLKTYLKKSKPDVTDENGNPVQYDKERFYATVNGEDFVVIQQYVFGILLQPITYFQPKSITAESVKKP